MIIQQIQKTMDLKPPNTYLSTMAGLVAVTGTISNTLSLSYFIHLRHTTSQSQASGNSSLRLTRNLFMALNSFDLTLCVFLFLCSIRGAVNNDEIMLACYIICMLASQTTGFITCVLSVTRAINLWKPFYIFHRTMVYVFILVFVLITLVLVTLSYLVDEAGKISIKKVFLVTLAIIYVIVISINTLSIRKLLGNPNISHGNEIRKATVTVAILSVVYCFFNTGFIVYLAKISFVRQETYESCSPWFHQVNVFVLLPLNSACNPVVYFIRKVEMRKYLLTLGIQENFRCIYRTKKGFR